MSDHMTLAEAAKTSPIAGYDLSATTLWRWCAHGVNGVKMRHSRIGKRYVIDKTAINDFLKSLENAPTEPKVGKQRPHVADARMGAAIARLAERGL